MSKRRNDTRWEDQKNHLWHIYEALDILIRKKFSKRSTQVEGFPYILAYGEQWDCFYTVFHKNESLSLQYLIEKRGAPNMAVITALGVTLVCVISMFTQ